MILPDNELPEGGMSFAFPYPSEAELMRDAEYVEVSVDEVKLVTNGAVLLLVRDEDDDTSERWVPKSQIEEPDDLEKGDTDMVVMVTKWFADQEGIPY